MTLSNAASIPLPADSATILHTQTGLERLMGDHALYLQILRRFRSSYQGTVGQLRQMLDRNELPATQRIAHTLKGSAGMIGAQQVYLLATCLEAACATSVQHSGAQLELLDAALRKLLATIDTMLAEAEQDIEDGAADSPASPSNPPDARMLLQHLARLLEEGDGAAIDVLEQSASVLAAARGAGRNRQRRRRQPVGVLARALGVDHQSW